MTPWSVLCDFDGTISVDDVTDVLLERFGAPGWQGLEKQWRDGEISSRLCMQRQIALLNASEADLDSAIDDIRIDPAFPAFVHAVRRHGWPISIVSDGLDYAIRRILSQNGITGIPVYANHLLKTGPRSWRLESPHASPLCRVDSGTCKCACARREQENHQRVLLVGDGASDFCATGSVDFVFAKYSLNEYCRTHSIHHVSILGFADAIGLLPALADDAENLPVTTTTHRLELRADARR